MFLVGGRALTFLLCPLTFFLLSFLGRRLTHVIAADGRVLPLKVLRVELIKGLASVQEFQNFS